MPTVPVYNLEGKQVGSHNLSQRIFGIKVNPDLVLQAVLVQQANRRIVVSHAKTRSEVRGGGKKPWRQKGTGRARHGSIRSPLWKGGGVVFGPSRAKNYTLKLNQKAKEKALFMALSDKVSSERLILVNELELSQPKTKLFTQIINKLPVIIPALVVLPTSNNILRSTRNIPLVDVIRGDSLNVLDVVSHRTLLMPTSAVATIEATYRASLKERQNHGAP